MERNVKNRIFFHWLKKKGRPHLVDDEMLLKMKDFIIGSHLAGTVISQKMLTAIGKGVIEANEPKILEEFDESH